MSDKRLNVVLCWHMHQPQYKDTASGQYLLPWTYLHAMKDYIDMADILEKQTNAKAVVNFAPILLEQIDDYAKQLTGFIEHGDAIHDPLLAALASPTLPNHQQQKLDLIRQCTRANEKHLILPNEKYRCLVEIAKQIEVEPDILRYLSEQYLVDMLVWYHLVWMAEAAHRNEPLIEELVKKGQDYSLHDRQALLKVISRLINSVIPRYRNLAEQGQVELSMNPYAHPIIPLLIDLSSTYDAMPDTDMPGARHYPNGEQRARWHIEHGFDVFEHYFGFVPKGCWPSEGAVSTDTIKLLANYDLQWAATGEAVLRNSMQKANRSDEMEHTNGLHKPYKISDSSTYCFFRDDGLSDLIGFTYSDWHGDDAVANLINHIENIAQSCDDPSQQVVSIIMDGENAWEHYPNNGYYFLNALYEKLSTHNGINLTTFSEVVESDCQPNHLEELIAGSWVYGTFSTWIGDKDKNRGWDMLIEAKRAYDVVMASKHLTEADREAATQQLALCEGSDWFWWFGDYNPAEAVSDFEHLFRLHLAHLYAILGVEPPESLSHVFTQGQGDPEGGGAMRRGHE